MFTGGIQPGGRFFAFRASTSAFIASTCACVGVTFAQGPAAASCDCSCRVRSSWDEVVVLMMVLPLGLPGLSTSIGVLWIVTNTNRQFRQKAIHWLVPPLRACPLPCLIASMARSDTACCAFTAACEGTAKLLFAPTDV